MCSTNDTHNSKLLKYIPMPLISHILHHALYHTQCVVKYALCTTTHGSLPYTYSQHSTPIVYVNALNVISTYVGSGCVILWTHDAIHKEVLASVQATISRGALIRATHYHQLTTLHYSMTVTSQEAPLSYRRS